MQEGGFFLQERLQGLIYIALNNNCKLIWMGHIVWSFLCVLRAERSVEEAAAAQEGLTHIRSHPAS